MVLGFPPSAARGARKSFDSPSAETPGPRGDDVKDAIGVIMPEANDAAGKMLKANSFPSVGDSGADPRDQRA
jgi:hypothetical protein